MDSEDILFSCEVLHSVPEPWKFTESVLSSKAPAYLSVLCINYLFQAVIAVSPINKYTQKY